MSGRLLVVDDNEMNRDLLSRRLRAQGHTVTVATNGREALDALKNGHVDVMLLDIMMPEVNGFEVLEHMKATAMLRDVPVIMISAADEVGAVVRCIELGAEDYLPKPCDPVILRARVAATLEKKQLRDRERLHTKALERELDIGREIQRGFLPARLPELSGWEIAIRFQPARQVSGDFYDAFVLGDHKLAIVMGDVCDKGVGAALFMALFRTLIRATAERLGERLSPSMCVHNVMSGTNDYIARTHSQDNMFATVFLGILDAETGVVRYINAGHEPPIVAGAGRVRARLDPTGPALGLLPDAAFDVGEVRLGSRETLVLFTDGASEARSANGALLGDEALVTASAGETVSAEQMLERLECAVRRHAGGAEQSDDIAMLAVRRD